MSEVITSAGAPGTDAAGAVTTQGSPTVPTPAQRVAAAAALLGQAGLAPAPAPEVPKPPMPPAPGEDLASVIRAQREARQAAQAEGKKAASLEAELKEAREELVRVKADRQAFEDDPVGYAKDRKWTPEQQLLYGQSLLYDIVPDKADPNFRIKMFEDKQRRDRAADERARKAADERAAVEAQHTTFSNWAASVEAATQSFSPGSYPESEAWFGNDREAYMTSLVATAKNLAAVATQNGQVADLTPAALAAALEAETARRMADRDSRMQKRKPPAPPAAPPAVKAADVLQSVETASTKNMNGSGAPQPPPANDKERIARAIEAGWRTQR